MGTLKNSFFLQSNFTEGELTPQLYTRPDFEGYYKGAQRLRNVLVIPQGGVKRRFGTNFVDKINATNAADIRIIVFDFTATTQYLVVLLPNTLNIYYNNVAVATVGTPYNTGEIAQVRWAETNGKLILTHPLYPPQILSLLTGPYTFQLAPFVFSVQPTAIPPGLNYSNCVFTPSAATGNDITLTITTGPSIFTSDFVGGLFFGNGGTGRIVSFTGSNIVMIDIVTDFIDTSAIEGTDAVIELPVFSNDLGWPFDVDFFQNRLVFSGTNTYPNSLFFSVINNYGDFDETRPDIASQGIAVFPRSSKNNVNQAILSTTSFCVFTTSGIFSTPPTAEQPFTPTDASFFEQTKTGVAPVKPVVLDNKIIYIDLGGRIVRALQFEIQQQSYISENISVQSAHLINNPVEMAVFQNSSIDDGEYLLLVNSDGTLAVYQSLQAEDVSAWTLQETDGEFVHVASSVDVVWFVVQRFINGEQQFFLEELNFNAFTDACTQNTYDTPQTVITGLDYLNNTFVRIRGDNYVMDSQFVVNGQLTLEAPVSTVEIGLNYNPLIRTMPINVQTYTGPTYFLQKRINTFFISFYQSLGIYIDGTPVIFPFLDTQILDTSPVPQNGERNITLMKGFDPEQTVDITQEDPVPMLILGVGAAIQNANGFAGN